jgi:dTDP-4-dehydrorhamnose reductase
MILNLCTVAAWYYLELMKKILVTGSRGQLGRALRKILGETAHFLDRQSFDLAKPETLKSVLDQYRPETIFNAAAYTKVDLAEKETALAEQVNATSVGEMAQWAAANAATLVHFSTDYVYSGAGTRPWLETDPTGPVNHYGKTKLKGDKAVAAAKGNYLIFRTSWVYDAEGANFLQTMLRLGAQREELSVVADQFGAPTFAHDLAAGAVRALGVALQSRSFPAGIYNLTNSGETSWHQFALEIFGRASARGLPLLVKDIRPILSTEYPTPAQRPKNSRLSSQKFEDTFGFTCPDWKDGLRRCLESKYESH